MKVRRYICPRCHRKFDVTHPKPSFDTAWIIKCPGCGKVISHDDEISRTADLLTDSPRFGSWLSSTAELQAEAFGAEPENAVGDEWADYVTWNCAALMTEMGEFMQELPWRPWKQPRGKPDRNARARAVMEMVDVLHFAGNLLIAMGVTDEELSAVYKRKQNENRDRVLAGRSHPTNVWDSREQTP